VQGRKNRSISQHVQYEKPTIKVHDNRIDTENSPEFGESPLKHHGQSQSQKGDKKKKKSPDKSPIKHDQTAEFDPVAAEQRHKSQMMKRQNMSFGELHLGQEKPAYQNLAQLSAVKELELHPIASKDMAVNEFNPNADHPVTFEDEQKRQSFSPHYSPPKSSSKPDQTQIQKEIGDDGEVDNESDGNLDNDVGRDLI
jgi:hypothetical protein